MINARTRRKFTPEFKDEAVKMVTESSRPIASVAREIHVNEGTLGNWVSKYRVELVDEEPPLSISERARLRELEREVRELKMKAGFLRKAAAFRAITSGAIGRRRRPPAAAPAWQPSSNGSSPTPTRPTATVAGDTGPIPDLVARDFGADAPGTRLVGDITYLPTWQGWLSPGHALITRSPNPSMPHSILAIDFADVDAVFLRGLPWRSAARPTAAGPGAARPRRVVRGLLPSSRR
jgi:transposase-like protein